MRNLFYIALALFTFSCARNEAEQGLAGNMPISIKATFADENPATKVTATEFEQNDSLGLFVTKSGQDFKPTGNFVNNARLVVQNDKTIKGDPKVIYYPNVKSSLYSYYPYQSGDATADALGVQVGIRTDQTDSFNIKMSDLCYGSRLDTEPSNAAQALTFTHKFAQLRVKITTYTGCPKVENVRLLDIKDSATLNIQTGVITLKTSTSEIKSYNTAENYYSAIIPAQSLNGACIAIDLEGGDTYIYNTLTPIDLTQSSVNLLNLLISDKGEVILNGTPKITNWTSHSIISDGSEGSEGGVSGATDNQFTFYWSPAITDFGRVNKAFITLTNLTTATTKRYEIATITRDALSTSANAIYRFELSAADQISIGYPSTIDKFELFDGTTAIHTLTDYYGRTITKPGAHTFGTVTSLKLSPAGDWTGVANTAQSRVLTITTTANTTWIATASGTGLSVLPSTGGNNTKATISWTAQIANGDSPARQGTVTFTTAPNGVSVVMATDQLMGPYYLAIAPIGDWANVANTAQSRAITISTGNLTGWTAATNGAVGLDVTPKSGKKGEVATIKWAAQAVGAAARSGSVTFSPNPASTATPITISTNQLAGINPTLSVSAAVASMEASANSAQLFTLTATNTAPWTISNNSGGWLTQIPSSGTGTGSAQGVTLTALANNTSTTRTATVTVTCLDVTKTVTVTQKAPVLTLSATTQTVLPTATSATFSVRGTNQNGVIYTPVKGANATSVTPSTATTINNNAYTGAVTVNFTANATGASRNVVATVKYGASLIMTHTITQSSVTLSITPTTASVGVDATSAAFKVTSNVPWSGTVTGTSPSLSPASSTSASSAATVTLSFAKQGTNAAAARTHTATITPNPNNSASSQTRVFTVTQAERPATLSLSSSAPGVTIPRAGASYSTTVTSNTSWTASGHTNVTTSPGSGNAGSTPVTITVAKTTAGTTRTARVNFNTNAITGVTAAPTRQWAGTQETGLTISASPTTWNNVSGYGASTTITVTVVGGTWTASSSNSALTVKNNGNNTATLTWAAHKGTTAPATRSATVTFSTSPAGASATVTSAQNGVALPDYVVINDLKWKTYNVGTTSPTGYGNYYNFNNANNACPSGWRLPSREELIALNAAGAGPWTQLADVYGRWFGPNAASANASTAIFLSAAGYDGGGNGTAGTRGWYWSSTPQPDGFAYFMDFRNNVVSPEQYGNKETTLTVRCVQSEVLINGTWWALSNTGSACDWNTALTRCESPWRLPSKTDFENLINSGQMSQVTGLDFGRYWSSTFNYYNYAYHLDEDRLSSSDIGSIYFVRCCK